MNFSGEEHRIDKVAAWFKPAVIGINSLMNGVDHLGGGPKTAATLAWVAGRLALRVRRYLPPRCRVVSARARQIEVTHKSHYAAIRNPEQSQAIALPRSAYHCQNTK
jgi:hypothetical protein